LVDGRVQAFKDGRSWQIGTAREVSWIANRTTGDLSITAAIPPAFEAYATCYEPDGVTIEAHDRDDGTATETNSRMPLWYSDT
jgi:hypothetical protein